MHFIILGAVNEKVGLVMVVLKGGVLFRMIFEHLDIFCASLWDFLKGAFLGVV